MICPAACKQACQIHEMKWIAAYACQAFGTRCLPSACTFASIRIALHAHMHARTQRVKGVDMHKTTKGGRMQTCCKALAQLFLAHHLAAAWLTSRCVLGILSIGVRLHIATGGWHAISVPDSHILPLQLICLLESCCSLLTWQLSV